MPIIVQKFGGTSVADIEHIHNVAQKVKNEIDLGNQVVGSPGLCSFRSFVPFRLLTQKILNKQVLRSREKKKLSSRERSSGDN